jgi:hypothetical protein
MCEVYDVWSEWEGVCAEGGGSHSEELQQSAFKECVQKEGQVAGACLRDFVGPEWMYVHMYTGLVMR